MTVLPKTGGGGVVAMIYVNNRPRDGRTVLAITPTHLFAIARGQGPLSIDDLVGVARATDDPIVVMVKGDSEIQTLTELIQLGRERPIKWGATQIGGVDHVAGAILGQIAETQLSVVPFSGGGEIVTNLMGGSIDAAGLNLTEALDQIERGDFRALAVMADERIAILRDCTDDGGAGLRRRVLDGARVSGVEWHAGRPHRSPRARPARRYATARLPGLPRRLRTGFRKCRGTGGMGQPDSPALR